MRSQRRYAQFAGDVPKPLYYLFMERDTMRAALLLFFIFQESGIEDTVVPLGCLRTPERPKRLVHMLLELFNVRERRYIVGGKVVFVPAARVERVWYGT